MELDQYIESVKTEILQNEGVVSVGVNAMKTCHGFSIEVVYKGAGTWRLRFFTHIDLINFEEKKVVGFAHFREFECLKNLKYQIKDLG